MVVCYLSCSVLGSSVRSVSSVVLLIWQRSYSIVDRYYIHNKKIRKFKEVYRFLSLLFFLVNTNATNKLTNYVWLLFKEAWLIIVFYTYPLSMIARHQKYYNLHLQPILWLLWMVVCRWFRSILSRHIWKPILKSSMLFRLLSFKYILVVCMSIEEVIFCQSKGRDRIRYRCSGEGNNYPTTSNLL